MQVPAHNNLRQKRTIHRQKVMSRSTQRQNWGDLPVVLSERRTSVDTGSSRRSCLPGRGRQKCAAGACWPAQTLGKEQIQHKLRRVYSRKSISQCLPRSEAFKIIQQTKNSRAQRDFPVEICLLGKITDESELLWVCQLLGPAVWCQIQGNIIFSSFKLDWLS